MDSKIKKWEVLKEEDISPSKWFKLSKERVRLPNITETDYYVQKLDDVVMIFAVNDNHEIVLVNQYKHGAREVMLELPAGRVDLSGDIQAEARRELLEETGYSAIDLNFLGKIITEPSKSCVRVHCYFTNSVKFTGEQKFDENEDIEVVYVPIQEIDKWILDGRITASDTLAVIKIVQLKFPEIFK